LYDLSYKPWWLAHQQRHFVRIIVQTLAVGASTEAFCTVYRTNLGGWRINRGILYELSYKPWWLAHQLRFPNELIEICPGQDEDELPGVARLSFN
jgi:hypothetical protein